MIFIYTSTGFCWTISIATNGAFSLLTHLTAHSSAHHSSWRVRWQVETQQDIGAESGSSPMPDDALSDRIALLFQEADTDRNGTLSRAEFQAVRTWYSKYIRVRVFFHSFRTELRFGGQLT